MLKVGQYVTIERPPSFGRYFFDEDTLRCTDRVAQIYQHNGGVSQYRLADYPNECLWVEEDLTPTDVYRFSAPNKYDVGDTVTVDPSIPTDKHEHTITSVYRSGGGYMYGLGMRLCVAEYKLNPQEPKYTLF